jgi:hypothetical protein
VSVTLDARSKEREYAYPRDWYAAVIADDVAGKPDGAALVANSYAATFRPVAFPAKGHAYRLPDGSIEHDGTYARLPRAEDYADREWRPSIMVSMDAAGGFVRDQEGRIIRDRREVARLLDDTPDFLRFALALLREPAPGGRKRCAPWTIARRLLFADLQPAFGTRPTARLLLAWEDELGAPWRLPGIAALVARFGSGGALTSEERRKLRRAEQTMRRACLPRQCRP